VKCAKKQPGLPPRKALKGLVQKELDKVAPAIFEELMKCKELGKVCDKNSVPQ